MTAYYGREYIIIIYNNINIIYAMVYMVLVHRVSGVYMEDAGVNKISQNFHRGIISVYKIYINKNV